MAYIKFNAESKNNCLQIHIYILYVENVSYCIEDLGYGPKICRTRLRSRYVENEIAVFVYLKFIFGHSYTHIFKQEVENSKDNFMPSGANKVRSAAFTIRKIVNRVNALYCQKLKGATSIHSLMETKEALHLLRHGQICLVIYKGTILRKKIL